MYDYIREAIDRGEVLLEWDYSKADKPPVPLVKDKYGSERRKAKTLNFSIAYGKTVHGLAEDWGITKEEAQKTLEAWYRDRPEVKKWQDETKLSAEETGKVYTLMGRHRNLFDAMGYTPEDELNSKLFTNELNDWRRKRTMKSKLEGVPINDESLAAYTAKIEELDAKVKGIQDMRRRKEQARRASINTPIQGSAADIVMMAMIRLYRSDVLKRLGWRLLLQIHDEVILEGPVESRDEVCMYARIHQI
jgi:DNA polymerase-1